MREILFRGKRFDNGEWIEGNYRAVRNSHFSYIECIDKPTDCYRIDHETVGQYAGMTDRNGKKIFEGDICLGVLKTRFEVYWDKERTAFMAREKHDVPYGKDIDYYASYSDGKIGAEVIGNIYDNPELLNEV